MSDHKYHQALTANRKLLAEVASLKAEVERLQKLVGMQESIDKAIDAWIESKKPTKEDSSR